MLYAFAVLPNVWKLHRQKLVDVGACLGIVGVVEVRLQCIDQYSGRDQRNQQSFQPQSEERSGSVFLEGQDGEKAGNDKKGGHPEDVDRVGHHVKHARTDRIVDDPRKTQSNRCWRRV